MGVFGFLWGSLLGSWIEAGAYFVVLFARRPFRVVRETVGPMWAYGWPLIVTTLAGLCMHQANRYLLRWLLDDLHAIGIFAVAWTLANGVNQVVVTPFQSIWQAVMYEIHQMDDRLKLFQRVFKYYALLIALILLGVSVLSEPIVRVLAAAEFAEAASVLPWLCLAFFFFTLHGLVRAPAMVHARTVSVAGVSVIAALVNVGANVLLIPRFGIHGAAYAAVITYVTFTALGHVAYRRIEDMRLPLHHVGTAVVGGVALTAGVQWALPPDAGFVLQVVVGSAVTLAAAAAVLLGPARGLVDRRSEVWGTLAGALRRARQGQAP
jgi:O-antigen/teichoic acid export membrane protein